MWAMIPMLRTLARSGSTSRATRIFPCLAELSGLARSPAVVGEGLVGLSHLVRVLTALDARPEAVARVEQLVHDALDHGLLTTAAGVADQPAQREGGAATGLDLDRHLVGGTTDTARLDLDRRLHVVESALERDHRVGAGLLTGALERAVDDLLGDGALAVLQHLVDQLGDQRGAVDRVGDQRPLR